MDIDITFMSALTTRSGIASCKCMQAIIFVHFLLFFTSYSYGESQNEVLLVVHDREITKDEFLYHFQKNNQEIKEQNIEEYLELFIDFQLKLAQAEEEIDCCSRLHILPIKKKKKNWLGKPSNV
jgi:hypothetical protein